MVLLFNLAQLILQKTITRRTTYGGKGGGLFSVTNSVFMRNTYILYCFGIQGSGMFNYNNNNNISKAFFFANRSYGYGSAMMNEFSYSNVDNSLFQSNNIISTRASDGDGVFSNNGSISTVQSSTFVDNQSAVGSGSIVANNGATVNVNNSIMWANAGSAKADNATLNISYSILES